MLAHVNWNLPRFSMHVPTRGEIHYTDRFYFYFIHFCSIHLCRIIDNMPVSWCYEVQGGSKYCSPGFPIGCQVDKDGNRKDACIINVSLSLSFFSQYVTCFYFKT